MEGAARVGTGRQQWRAPARQQTAPTWAGAGGANLQQLREKVDDTVSNQALGEGIRTSIYKVEAAHHDEASHNSSSVLRKPGPPEDFVRGSTSNHPFLPGGFDVSISFDKKHAESRTVSDALQVLWDGGQLHTIPPGFPRGLNLEAPEPFSVRRKDAVVGQLVPLVQHDAKGLGQVSLINVFRQAWEQETNSELMQDDCLLPVAIGLFDEEMPLKADCWMGCEKKLTLHWLLKYIRSMVMGNWETEMETKLKQKFLILGGTGNTTSSQDSPKTVFG
ncbi:hypothetical protein L7F22_045999 [Adiantum nelumboides]|nr:hypothetical protein [Adiantum nelumboides]